MKILLIHTHYQFTGGEDGVFAQEKSLLEEGNKVKTLVFQNKTGWQGALQFLFSVWNPSAATKIKRQIQSFMPDVLHIHNWHYATGPALIRTAKHLGVPVIMTLHNYRILCPSGSLMNDSTIFTESLTVDFPWKAIWLKVYRNSTIQTFWLSFIIWFHKRIGTWEMVSRYITLTKPAQELFISSFLGSSAGKFTVKPNFVDISYHLPVKRSNTFLYVGRLSDEKGVSLLLSTFDHSNFNLSIAGDGPLIDQVRKAAAESVNITYLGNLDKEGVARAMQTSSALIFPSLWYETFGMVIIEAFALGCPVIASNLGSPIELVQDGINGLHFEAGNVDSLRNTLEQWTDLPEAEKSQYRLRARATYEQHYTPEANYQMLMNIYKSVVNTSTPATVEHIAA